jgi:hypothetical protein
MTIKLNPSGMLVAKDRQWANAHLTPPQLGSVVRALSRDGIDVGKVTWNRDSIQYYDGWAPLDSIPPDIKALQLKRYTDKYPELFKEQDDGQVSRATDEGATGSTGSHAHDADGGAGSHSG